MGSLKYLKSFDDNLYIYMKTIKLTEKEIREAFNSYVANSNFGDLMYSVALGLFGSIDNYFKNKPSIPAIKDLTVDQIISILKKDCEENYEGDWNCYIKECILDKLYSDSKDEIEIEIILESNKTVKKRSVTKKKVKKSTPTKKKVNKT